MADDDKPLEITRVPLPWWLRYLAPHPVAYDRLKHLYRYRQFDAAQDLDASRPGFLADTLATGRIFIPTYDMLNDPWEAAPRIENYSWRKDTINDIARFLAFLSPELENSKSLAEMKAEFSEFDPEVLLERIQLVLMKKLRQSPILSLSDRGDVLLMWSYYSKGHSGYALVFDAKKLPFAHARRVEYRKYHPKIYLSRRDMRNISVECLATKAKQWRHEREWRLILGEKHAKSTYGLENLVPASSRGFYGVLPKESIVGVIVGDQLYNGNHSRDVLELLSQYRTGLKIWLAEVDRTRFEIDLRPMRFT